MEACVQRKYGGMKGTAGAFDKVQRWHFKGQPLRELDNTRMGLDTSFKAGTQYWHDLQKLSSERPWLRERREDNASGDRKEFSTD